VLLSVEEADDYTRFAVLSPSIHTLRLTLHVLAAAVWVGGQLTLAGLVPTLRATAEDAPRAAARAFNRVAWPAFGVLVVTGVWNLAEVSFGDRDTDYQVTVFVKLLVVAASGIAAFLHSRASTKVGLAVGGAASGLSALAALFLGVLLRT
jgi:putative copper export protein